MKFAPLVAFYNVAAPVRLALLSCSLLGLAGAARAQDEDPKRYVAFVEEFSGTCTSRNGVQLLVKSTHPTRKLRVWLDRFSRNVGTGDRSRSDLVPRGEPEALGCSRTLDGGTQEWRIAKAQFID
ncbi:MAG TPA: hypothetical protein VFR90_01335 [Methylibium sp.]|uniref:hypothetical protein n=1 Tax=Methylibium sp. TaxID=2067992 RepID=UPI002DBE8FD8|nr:hypothetical protein [Methylibium sp.]HEU4457750.1 hypothetical protein [Methylibium sp.]